MSIVVICVDGLPLHLLGAYGNSAFETPAIDALAAKGFVLERAFVPGNRSYRQNKIHQWLRTYQQAGWEVTRFLPDIPSGQSSARGSMTKPSSDENDFETLVIPWVDAIDSADDWTECSTTIYVSQVLAQLDVMNLSVQKCIWIDLPLLNTAWDAPVEWRERLSGEDDPDVLPDVVRPEIQTTSAKKDLQALDPDLRFLWEQAASAQVMLLDRCVEVVADWISDAWPETSILLTADQGFSLGEHGQISNAVEDVYSEVTQVPMIFCAALQANSTRVPGIQNQLDWLELIGTVDREGENTMLAESLEDASQHRFQWCRYTLFDAGDSNVNARNAVVNWSRNQVAVRTNQWTFVWTKDQSVQLFVSPDDRFEQNDVADRCRALANLFLRNVSRFGVCLHSELSDVWWLNADETLPVVEAESSADKPAKSDRDSLESDDQESSFDYSCLARFPGDFWSAAI